MKTLSGIAAIILLSLSPQLQAANYCGEIFSGELDYTDSSNRAFLATVENYHFTSNIEHLTAGNTTSVGGDLSYTLEHFPNHHRALMAIGKLSLRDKKPRPQGARYSAECYFYRAIRFKPDDGIVHMVYGLYLAQAGNLGKAIDQLNDADRLQPDNANIHYNLGLLYMKKKDYPQAKAHAKKAYALGFPLPGLKRMLSKVGQWDAQPNE